MSNVEAYRYFGKREDPTNHQVLVEPPRPQADAPAMPDFQAYRPYSTAEKNAPTENCISICSDYFKCRFENCQNGNDQSDDCISCSFDPFIYICKCDKTSQLNRNVAAM